MLKRLFTHEALREGLVAGATTIVFAALLFTPLILEPFNGLTDRGQLALPARAFVGDRLAAGDLPFWLPWYGLGMPSAADATLGLFYPAQLLYALFPLGLAAALDLLVHLGLAAAFTFACSRALGTSRTGAGFATLFVLAAGPVLARLGDPSFIAALPWLPAAALAMGHLDRGEPWHRALLGGLALALAILAGCLPLALLIGLTMVGLGTISAARAGRAGLLLPTLFAVVVGAGLASPALFGALITGPDFQPIGAQPRAGLGVQGLFALLAPKLGGATLIGAVPILLAAIGFWRLRAAAGRSWAVVAAGALLVAVGFDSPLYAAAATPGAGELLARAFDAVILLWPIAFLILVVRGLMRRREVWRWPAIVASMAVFGFLFAIYAESFAPLARQLTNRPLFDLGFDPLIALVVVALALGLLAGRGLDAVVELAAEQRERLATALRRYGALACAVALLGLAWLHRAPGADWIASPRAIAVDVAILVAAPVLLYALVRRYRFATVGLAALFLVDALSGSRTWRDTHRAEPPEIGWNEETPTWLGRSAELLDRAAEQGFGRAWIGAAWGPFAAEPTLAAWLPVRPTPHGIGSLIQTGPVRSPVLAELLSRAAPQDGEPRDLVAELPTLSRLGARWLLLSSDQTKALGARLNEVRELVAAYLPGPGTVLLDGTTREGDLIRFPPTSELASNQRVPTALVPSSLQPNTCYRLAAVLSAKDPIPRGTFLLDLYGPSAGYDNGAQEMEIELSEVRAQPTAFSRQIDSGDAPEEVVLRAFGAPRRELLLHRASLTPCEDHRTVTSLLTVGAEGLGNVSEEEGGFLLGPGAAAVVTTVELEAGTLYQLVLSARRTGGRIDQPIRVELRNPTETLLRVETVRQEPQRFAAVFLNRRQGTRPIRIVSNGHQPVWIERAVVKPWQSRMTHAALGEAANAIVEPLAHLRGVVLVHNRAAAPRAWLALRAETAANPADAANRANGMGSRDTAVVEGIRPGPYAPGEVQVLDSDDVDEVRVRARAGGDGLLILNEQYAPGWSATVNGEPAKVRRANGLLRAIEIPAGVSEVVLHFDAPAVRDGLTRALSTTIGLVLVIAAVWWRRRHPPRVE